MTYQIVLPFIYEPYMRECIATIKVPKENMLLIDNTKINQGVAGSWNKGIELMYERNCDWLIILSAAVRFGENGMLDFIEELEKTDKDILACEPSIGWHCIGIRRSVFDAVGTFDENFYPIYFEEVEWSYRCQLVGIVCWGSTDKVQIENLMWAHSGKLAGVKSDGERLLKYLLCRWGGVRDKYEFKTPFNDPARSIKDWRKGDIDIYCPL